MIYPACGVDALVALFANKVVGVNLRSYTASEMIEQLQPLVDSEIASTLNGTVSRLEFLARVDASSVNLLERVISKYKNSPPKALLLKGAFESLFLQEWDIDMERFYSVPYKSAVASATEWLSKIVSWLANGDRVICFDDQLQPALDDEKRLLLRREIKSEGAAYDAIRRGGITILYCANGVRVYEKRSSEA